MKRLLRSATAAVALVFLGTAAAGAQPSTSITICEHRNFQGRCVTLRHGANDLREWGISNRVSSFRVERGGQWLLCTGLDFTGYCEPVRGLERDLSHTRLQDSISSLRPLRVGPGGGPGGGRSGSWNETAIAVYTLPGFRGRSWVFSDDIPDLSRVGLNRQISSVRVLSGRWQICEQRDYRNCRDVMRDIPDLRAIGMNNRISSIREGGSWGWGRGDEGRGGRGDLGRGRGEIGRGPEGRAIESGREYQLGRPGGDRSGPAAPATLFDGPGFSGRALDVRGEISDLRTVGFNDAAVSLRITSGLWQVCTDVGFAGRCEVFRQSADRLGLVFARTISSIRPY
jgi:Beta/Gamma crystallin